MEGQVSLFAAEDGPCYRCVFPSPPSPENVLTCEEAGVLGVIPGTIGTLQATVAIQWILGQESPLRGALLVYDATRMNFETIHVSRDPKCATCSGDPSKIELIDYAGFCGVSIEEPELALPTEAQIEPVELKARMDAGTAPPVFDIRPSPAWEIFRFEGAVHTSRDALLERAVSLGKEAEFVVVCKIGRRSARVVEELRHRGFSRVRNLRGGLAAWVRDVDPDAPIY